MYYNLFFCLFHLTLSQFKHEHIFRVWNYEIKDYLAITLLKF